MVMTSSTNSASSPSVMKRPMTIATSFLLLVATCAGACVLLVGHRSDFGAESSIRLRNDLRHRKLLLAVAPDLCSANNNESHSLGNKDYKPNRAWGEDKCSESDIVIDQGPSAPLPSGIPTYSVAILNACSSGCDIGGIHLRCGKFSTAKLIDPNIFKRLDYDDCLVYGGRPIPNGMTLSFEYANTYPYPMDVIKYQCCPSMQ